MSPRARGGRGFTVSQLKAKGALIEAVEASGGDEVDMDALKRRSKFGNKPETFRGRRFDSRAEAAYAKILQLRLMRGSLITVVCQPAIDLGDHPTEYLRYIPDFLVVPMNGMAHYVDVKGKETAKFRDVRKWWHVHGPADLVVVRLERGTFIVSEIIQGRFTMRGHKRFGPETIDAWFVGTEWNPGPDRETP